MHFFTNSIASDNFSFGSSKISSSCICSRGLSQSLSGNPRRILTIANFKISAAVPCIGVLRACLSEKLFLFQFDDRIFGRYLRLPRYVSVYSLNFALTFTLRCHVSSCGYPALRFFIISLKFFVWFCMAFLRYSYFSSCEFYVKNCKKNRFLINKRFQKL